MYTHIRKSLLIGKDLEW